MPKADDDDPADDDSADDVTGAWDELYKWVKTLESLDFLDDSEPEPDYGDFWLEDDDSDD